ncbi:hypothetical protein [Rhizobium sp.]
MKKFVICAAMLLAAGCAKAPEDIAATPVAVDPYMQMQCPQLASLRTQKTAELAVLERKQLEAARNDATGMATIHLPVGSMVGKDREPEYAQAKGEVQAINTAYQTKSCAAS